MRIFGRTRVIHIGLLDANNSYREPLKLSTRQEIDVSIAHLVQFYSRVSLLRYHCGNVPTQNVHNLLNVVHLVTCFQQSLYCPVGTFDSFRQLIDILRLNNSLKVIFQYFGKVVWVLFSMRSRLRSCGPTLKLRPSKVF